MKVLKNKKALSSVAAILVALALIAGSTMAWFVVKQDVALGNVPVGALGYVAENLWVEPVDYLFQPGEVAGAERLFDNGVYLDESDWASGTYDALIDELGYIENNGTLNIIIQLGAAESANVMRIYEDPNDEFPSTAQYTDLIEVAPYPAVPGAVGMSLILADTPDTVAAFTGDTEVLVDENGLFYLKMAPGDKIHAVLVVDLKTNASYAVLESLNFERYLDNTYAECEIDYEGSWYATQDDMDDAKFDVFGASSFTAVDLNALSMAFDWVNSDYAASVAAITEAMEELIFDNFGLVPGDPGYDTWFDTFAGTIIAAFDDQLADAIDLLNSVGGNYSNPYPYMFDAIPLNS